MMLALTSVKNLRLLPDASLASKGSRPGRRVFGFEGPRPLTEPRYGSWSDEGRRGCGFPGEPRRSSALRGCMTQALQAWVSGVRIMSDIVNPAGCMTQALQAWPPCGATMIGAGNAKERRWKQEGGAVMPGFLP